MFDGNEEHEPRGEREEALHHHPHAHIEHLAQQAGTEAGQAIEGIARSIASPEGVDDEEEHGKCTRQARRDGCTGNAQFRKSPMTEDEEIVEEDVARHHDHRVELQHTGTGGGDIEGAEQ